MTSGQRTKIGDPNTLCIVSNKYAEVILSKRIHRPLTINLTDLSLVLVGLKAVQRYNYQGTVNYFLGF